MSTSPRSPTSSSILFSPFHSPTMATKPRVETNVQIDADGFTTLIKWTFVGRGEEKRDTYCSRNEAERHSGISNMGKKEERVHAELQAQDITHDRSHSITPDASNFHAFQKMSKDQMLHGNTWHDKHFLSLAKITSTRVNLNNGG